MGNPDLSGQPGFTPAERRRFQGILENGRMVDAYRRMHPAIEQPPAEGPYFTWRGTAKYFGKGMRIDYGLVARELLPRVEEASIFGSGSGLIGFLGSDHCPIGLKLCEVNAHPAPHIAMVKDEG